MRLIAEGARKEQGMPRLWGGFERLAQEMKKREQKGVVNG
jgi:hypothetical protein